MFIFYFHLKHQDKPDNDCAYDKKKIHIQTLNLIGMKQKKKIEIAKIASSLLKIVKN